VAANIVEIVVRVLDGTLGNRTPFSNFLPEKAGWRSPTQTTPSSELSRGRGLLFPSFFLHAEHEKLQGLRYCRESVRAAM
jgi:hypothetical protein